MKIDFLLMVKSLPLIKMHQSVLEFIINNLYYDSRENIIRHAILNGRSDVLDVCISNIDEDTFRSLEYDIGAPALFEDCEDFNTLELLSKICDIKFKWIDGVMHVTYDIYPNVFYGRQLCRRWKPIYMDNCTYIRLKEIKDDD